MAGKATERNGNYMINIILTFDYEIFGNGSGDIQNCLINPTNNILTLLDKKNAKAIFFVDYGLLQALEKITPEDRIAYFGHDPLEAIWNQLEKIIEKHDIQLHIHPQMINAPFEGGQFKVDLNRWRITDLPYSKNKEILSINGLIASGKSYLEKKIRTKKNDYICCAFRAGGLCAQPEKNLLKALKENHFIMDFSTSYKYFIDAWPAKVDYRESITDVWPKMVRDSFKDNSDEGIWEFPIFGYEQSLYNRLLKKIKRVLKKEEPKWSPQRPSNCKGNPQKLLHQRTIVAHRHGGILKSLKQRQIFRFYLEGKKEIMSDCFKAAMKYSKKKSVYMVGIGHPKAMGDLSQLEAFFDFTNQYCGKIKFLTTFELKELIESGKM